MITLNLVWGILAVQIVLVRSKSFWSGPNRVQVQIRLLWTNFYNLDLSKMIWTHPKQWVLEQNDLDPYKDTCYFF